MEDVSQVSRTVGSRAAHAGNDPAGICPIRPGRLGRLEPALDYSFVRQDVPGGNGDAVRLGASFTGPDPFVVAWGDAVIRSAAEGGVVRRMMETHAKEGAACTIAVEYVPEDKVSRYGIVRPRFESGSAFPIDDIVEKPAVENAPSRYAVSARYICGPGIFPALESTPRGQERRTVACRCHPRPAPGGGFGLVRPPGP